VSPSIGNSSDIVHKTCQNKRVRRSFWSYSTLNLRKFSYVWTRIAFQLEKYYYYYSGRHFVECRYAVVLLMKDGLGKNFIRKKNFRVLGSWNVYRITRFTPGQNFHQRPSEKLLLTSLKPLGTMMPRFNGA